MYQAPSSATGHYSEEMEGYLLGKRRIDGILLKNDTDNQKLEKGADVVGANAAAGPSVGSARDTMTKVLNDPLLEVKKREQAALEAAMMEAARRREREARRKGDSGRDRDRDRDRRHRDHDSKRQRYSDEREDDRRHRPHRSERRRRSRSPASPERSHRRHRSERDREADHDRDRREDRRRGGDRDHLDDDRDRQSYRDDRDRDRDHSYDGERDHRDYREKKDSHSSHRDRDSGTRRNRDRDADRERSLRRTSPRRISPSTQQAQSRTDRGNGDRRDYPRRDYINRNDLYNRNRGPPPGAAPGGPDPKDQEEERLRKLAEMQSNATELEAERRQRIEEITAKEQEEKEADDKLRSDRGQFMSKVHERVQEDSLDERIRRSRGGLSKMEED